MKQSYTNLINIYVRDDKEQLQVFNRNGVYLPMKKIGKNNPKAEQMKTDNEMRKKWNQTVDRALIIGVPERQIIQVKDTEISGKAKESVKQFGRQPQLFATIILSAIAVLERLITQIFRLAYLRASRENTEEVAVSKIALEESQKVTEQNVLEETIPEQPKKSPLAIKYPRLSEIHSKLEEQNHAIYQRGQQLSVLKEEVDNTKGVFKGKQRKELQEQSSQLEIIFHEIIFR